MTEEAKKRMFELAEKHAVAYRDDFKRNVAEFHFTEGYQAGMQDPDANKKPKNVIYYDEDNLYRLYCEMEKIASDRREKIAKLEAENKRLREALDICRKQRDDYHFVTLLFNEQEILDKQNKRDELNIQKALSSGGE